MDDVNASRAGRREWIGLAVIALPCLLYAMDLTVLELAVPAISADLQPTSQQLLWIIDIYGFFVAGCLITMGTLGDRIGRRRLLMIGAVAFGAASVLAAFSTSADMLIASRALLGIAGATVAPSTLSLIRNMFHDPRQRQVAISVWVTSFSVGAVLGPLLGGVLLEFFWWGSVFLLALPVMTLLLVLGPTLLPEFRDPHAGRMDLWSAGMSLIAVLSVIYGLKRFAIDGPAWTPAVFVVAGLVVGVVFVRRQRTLADPMIHLALFRISTFRASLTTNMLAFFAAFGSFFLIAQYLQIVLGLSPFRAGLWTVPSSLGFVIGAMVAPTLMRRVRPAVVVAGGLVVAAVGLAMLTQVDAVSGLAVLVTGSIVMALGLSPVITVTTDLIVGSAPPERAGAASALSETSAEFGGAVGIAILGSIGTAVYRGRILDTLPAGVPPAAVEAARDTLGGAVEAASSLQDGIGAALVEAAGEAFTGGLRAVAAVSATVTLVLAVVTALLLRDASAPEPEPKVEVQAEIA